MHLTLFAKSVVMACLSTLVIVLQSVEMLSNALPAGFMKITWAFLLLFFVWFVSAIYKDYKEFKARIYPYISDFQTRISVLENELERRRE